MCDYDNIDDDYSYDSDYDNCMKSNVNSDRDIHNYSYGNSEKNNKKYI